MAAKPISYGFFSCLQKRFAERDVRIGVFGLSKEGLRLAVRQAESGFHVSCFDFRDYRLDMARRGISFTSDISDSELSGLVRRGLVSATDDFHRIKDLDFLAICIPEEKSMKPGCYNITDISKIIGRHMSAGLIIGFEDLEKAERLKNGVEDILKSSGFRNSEDYLFGAITKRG